jgi:phage gpG-like protein
MIPSFEINQDDIKKLIAKLQGATKEEVIRKGLSQSSLNLRQWIVKNRFAPRGIANSRVVQRGILTARSGLLQASITGVMPSNVIRSGGTYEARIGTNKEYAPQHELGLTVTKTSKRGKLFEAHYPKRPFLKPAIEDQSNQQRAVDIMTKVINEALAKA